MSERIFIALINGDVYRKDTAIRTYKTRERAEKETGWAVRHGYKVEIGELTMSDVRETPKEDVE